LVKSNGLIAHGKTLKKANDAVISKIEEQLNTDEKIELFIRTFNNNEKYLGKSFFEWHHKLTGSCLQGRENFVKQNELNLRKKYTVKEFIEICKNAYEGQIIKRLKEFYK
jgi:hypothetical protein